MNRRAFLFAALRRRPLQTRRRRRPTLQVIYVGGWDCPYCTMWQNKYEGRQWLASPEFKQVAWIEVDPPQAARGLSRNATGRASSRRVLEQIPRKSGTPRFLIVRNGKIVSNEFGGRQVGARRWRTSRSCWASDRMAGASRRAGGSRPDDASVGSVLRHAARRSRRRRDQDRKPAGRFHARRAAASSRASRRPSCCGTATSAASRSTSRTPTDLEIFWDLVDGADVVLENFRPGVMDRLGIGWDGAAASATRGWCWARSRASARPGPTPSRGGFDLVIQAMSGLMSVTGPEGRPALPHSARHLRCRRRPLSHHRRAGRPLQARQQDRRGPVGRDLAARGHGVARRLRGRQLFRQRHAAGEAAARAIAAPRPTRCSRPPTAG